MMSTNPQAWTSNKIESTPKMRAKWATELVDLSKKMNYTVYESADNHYILENNRLDTNENYNLPVVQGTLNPNLKNITKRTLCIDSQFRQNILPFSNNNVSSSSFNTDYILDLTEPLLNVISLRLFSIQIPTTWYTFDTHLGNNTFTLIKNSVINTLTLEPGNYSFDELITQLESLIGRNIIVITRNTNNGILSFKNTNTSTITIVFYDSNSNTTCGTGKKINRNLGWNLGFRRNLDSNGEISIIINANQTISADSPVNVYGSKYFTLMIDDFNKNHLNKGLINITDNQTKLNLPSYYSGSNTCLDSDNNITGVANTIPRKFTQAQLYSINQILYNRKQNTNRTFGNTSTDTLCLIPLRDITSLRPDPYIQYGSSLSVSERKYFGPVNIERLRVKLLDETGLLVNLHDNDWSFTLIVEQLYQY